jgi:hypothetical protein
MGRLLNEPTLIAGALRAIILCAVSFGWELTVEQIAQIMLALEAVLTLVNRALVTPNQLAESRVDSGGRPTVPTDKSYERK